MSHGGNEHVGGPNPLISWLFTTNHKNVGVLYLVTSLYFLVVAGVLALTFRLQLSEPNNVILGPDAYNRAMTLHGLFMLLWVTTPLAAALANYFVPIQIGAKDMAFPRLNALSYWLYLSSGIVALSSFFAPGGTADWGWYTYQPLASLRYSPQIGGSMMAFALLLLLASTTVGTVNFIVTIFRLRAPGMKILNLPLFSLGWLATNLILLWAFPAFMAPLILLVTDRLLGTVFYTSAEGGPLLWAHLFWFFGHPEVYILLIPGLMAVGDIIAVSGRRAVYAKPAVWVALLVASFQSWVVWAHHMFQSGIHTGLREAFNITTELISIPFAVIVIAFLLTLVGGRIRITTPMLFALGSLALFIIGGASGVFNSSVALNIGLHGTFWVVGHFHYTIVGAGITGLVAAIYYFWPKMTGRLFSETLGKIHFVVHMVGFNLLYFPMHMLFDMPRRVYTYVVEAWGPVNMVITIGAFTFAAAWALFFAILFHSLARGSKAPDDPWDAAPYSLEWNIPSPPPEFNFPHGIPSLSPTGKISWITTNGASPSEHSHPHLSPWPFIVSVGTSLIGVGLFMSPPMTVLGLAAFVAAIVGWAYDDLKDRFKVVIEAIGEKWPFERDNNFSLGMWTLIIGEVALVGPIFSGYVFARANSLLTGFRWPAPGEVHPIELGLLNTIILTTSGLTATLAYLASKKGERGQTVLSLTATLALGLAFLGIKAFEWWELHAHGITFGTDIASSFYYVLTGIHASHLLAGVLVLPYLILKAHKGGYDGGKAPGIEMFAIYWGFVDIVWLFIFPSFYLL